MLQNDVVCCIHVCHQDCHLFVDYATFSVELQLRFNPNVSLFAWRSWPDLCCASALDLMVFGKFSCSVWHCFHKPDCKHFRHCEGREMPCMALLSLISLQAFRVFILS